MLSRHAGAHAAGRVRADRLIGPSSIFPNPASVIAEYRSTDGAPAQAETS